jgi:hypothetical protein
MISGEEREKLNEGWLLVGSQTSQLKDSSYLLLTAVGGYPTACRTSIKRINWSDIGCYGAFQTLLLLCTPQQAPPTRCSFTGSQHHSAVCCKLWQYIAPYVLTSIKLPSLTMTATYGA